MTEPDYVDSFDDVVCAAWLDRVHDRLARAWHAVPAIPEGDRMLFELAVAEIATNVYTHAETSVGAVRVTVALDISADRLQAVLTDTADTAVFDISAARMPSTYSESGRGIPLARTALDDLTHSVGDGGAGNVWRLSRAVSGVRAD